MSVGILVEMVVVMMETQLVAQYMHGIQGAQKLRVMVVRKVDFALNMNVLDGIAQLQHILVLILL